MSPREVRGSGKTERRREAVESFTKCKGNFNWLACLKRVEDRRPRLSLGPSRTGEAPVLHAFHAENLRDLGMKFQSGTSSWGGTRKFFWRTGERFVDSMTPLNSTLQQTKVAKLDAAIATNLKELGYG